jgi:3-oxoacyl-[acyl-carrier protein] reductase
MIDLKGKSALITGSGRGIGKEIAIKLAKAGADVCISDIDLATAQQTAEEIAKEYGVKTIALAANVANEAEVTELVKKFVEFFGKIDILVNNAGITKDGLVIDMKESDWDAVLGVNLKSAFLCSKAAARPMLKARVGRIINIASISGQIGLPGQANYSASKAGMIGLTKAVAKECAKRGVTVNAIAPGFIRTAMTDKLSPEVVKGYEDAIPMKVLGLPEDIANSVLFLASDLSSYITGQVIAVNGGLAM